MVNFINNETPLSAENLNKMQLDLLKTVFPIGSTYITQGDINPSTILNFGIWERLKGKVCLGLDEDDKDLSEIGKTGGEKTHTLTKEELPNLDFAISHGTLFHSTGSGTGLGVESYSTGGGQAHNNMQPYEVVGYMWIRRA